MDEGVLEPEEMVVVVLVELGIKLESPLSARRESSPGGLTAFSTYQIQDRDFHHTLVEIGRAVLDHLDRDNLLRLHVLALYHLAEGTLAKDVEDQIAVLVAGLLGAQDVVDVENVIAILVVVAIVLDSLARLGQHSARIARGLVFETRVADAVGRGEVDGERLERLSTPKLAFGGSSGGGGGRGGSRWR